MKGLFLDDVRMPHDVRRVRYPRGIEWTIVRTLKDFAAAVESEKFDVFSFDMWLEETDSSHTGLDCVEYLVFQAYDGEIDIKGAQFFYHTADASAAEKMERLVKQYT